MMADQALINEVAAEIKAVSAKLEELEVEIKQARAEHNNEEVAALRTKEEQLRNKEEQLRAEKLLLLARQPGALCASPQFRWCLAFTRAAVVLSGRSSSGSERGSPPEAASAFALAAVVAC